MRSGAALALLGGILLASKADDEIPGAAGAPYPGMPAIAPIGARIAKYMDGPDSAKGRAVDPAKGYRLQVLGKGLYMITDNAYQSMFMTYESVVVVVVDAPPTYAGHIHQAIAEVTNKPITHLIYSHSHIDHIGGAKGLGGNPVIVAHEETKRLLARANDCIGGWGTQPTSALVDPAHFRRPIDGRCALNVPSPTATLAH